MEKELKAFGIKENNLEIPQMVAKGSGLEAEIIVNKAKKEGIEIIKVQQNFWVKQICMMEFQKRHIN